MVNPSVVQNDHGTWQETRKHLLLEERLDILTPHCSFFVPKREHALHVQGTQNREVLAPTERYRLEEALASSCPTVMLIKRERETRLVDEDQIIGSDRL